MQPIPLLDSPQEVTTPATDTPAPAGPAIVRQINAMPFCWQHKVALRKIREAFDRENTVSSALGVYTALTEIASNESAEVFQTTHAFVAEKSGLSPRTVRAVLPGLMEINLLEISTPVFKCPSTYRLLAVRQRLPNDDRQRLPLDDRQRTKKAALPPSEESKNKVKKKGEEAPPDCPLARVDAGLLVKDIQRMEREIEALRASGKPDRKEIIAGLRAEIRRIEDEIKRRAPKQTPARATPAVAAAKPTPASVKKLVPLPPDAREQWQRAIAGGKS